MNPYTYANDKNSFKTQLKEATSRWERYTVEFPTAHPDGYARNNIVRGEYLFPCNDGAVPLAILVHGMGDRSVIPCKLLARTLAKRGIASFILYLVFHESRIPETIKGRFPRLTADEWFESYQISVTDIRKVIDWANTRSEIDNERVAVAGISFGGFVSAIAMAIDKRIKAGVLVVSGGNTEKMTRHSFILKRQYHNNAAEYSKNQERYRQYLDEVEKKGFENVNAAKQSYLTDPMTFASQLRGRPVLMLNALWDEMIPRVAAIDFWWESGKPPIVWLPATHATIWGWYPFIGPRVARFLKANLR